MKRITIGDRSMLVLGTVQGLTRERSRVRTAFDRFEPDMVALPISDEMLEGLKAVVEGEVKEVATNSIDDLFADHLRRFGEVQLPPPPLWRPTGSPLSGRSGSPPWIWTRRPMPRPTQPMCPGTISGGGSGI